MNHTIDKEVVVRRLERATKHVAAGQSRVDGQLALVARLERDGHDTLQAKRLLQQLEQTLAVQIATRDLIVLELRETEEPRRSIRSSTLRR